jgi:hypothetical protein
MEFDQGSDQPIAHLLVEVKDGHVGAIVACPHLHLIQRPPGPPETQHLGVVRILRIACGFEVGDDLDVVEGRWSQI